MKKFKFYPVLIFTLALLTLLCKQSTEPEEYTYTLPTLEAGVPAQSLEQFEQRLESLRIDMNNTPGMSACIIKNRQVVWAKGFGYADKEDNIQAAPNTVYSIASMTKSMASVVIMHLVEEGLLDLETPVSEFGIELESNGVILVKHLLTHTSESIPGTYFNYDGNRFSYLDQIIEQVSGKPFGELLIEKVIDPLGMTNTACNPYNLYSYELFNVNRSEFERKIAKPYWLDGKSPIIYDMYFGTSAGIFSSVMDLAKFSIAVDNRMLISEESWEEILTQITLNNGERFPYGYAWFIQNYNGVQIIWHGGAWNGTSGFLVKIPERELTFIIIGNTQLLQWSHPQIRNDGDVTRSVIVTEFLNAFIFGTAELPDTPWSPLI
ncbi:serine hydrolase domain-containing protein [candidate division KSB1 bacterium]